MEPLGQSSRRQEDAHARVSDHDRRYEVRGQLALDGLDVVPQVALLIPGEVDSDAAVTSGRESCNEAVPAPRCLRGSMDQYEVSHSPD
jgi:hypothetical protein